MSKELCPNCVNSVRCETWAEWKCKAYEKRVYDYDTLTNCKSFKLRDKNFKDPKCQCDDCLKNDILWEEDEENQTK